MAVLTTAPGLDSLEVAWVASSYGFSVYVAHQLSPWSSNDALCVSEKTHLMIWHLDVQLLPFKPPPPDRKVTATNL
jgi:hypothetical protein